MHFLKSKLLKQSSLYLLGQMLQKAISVLLIPVWTIYLLPADYGITGTLGAYGGILHLLLMLGIYAALVRHFFDFSDDVVEQRSYVFSNFVLLIGFSGMLLAALALTGEWWWPWVSADQIPFRPYVVLMLASAFLALISRFPYSLYQAQQKANACVIVDFSTFLISMVISLWLVIHLRKGAYGMLLGSTVAQAVVCAIVLVLFLRKWGSPYVRFSHMRKALAFGLPLVPHMLSGWVLNFVDRIMLERFVTLAEVGLYNLGYNLGMMMFMIITSINEAFQPYYFQLMKSGDNVEPRFLRIFAFYIAGVGLIGIGGSLFAQELVQILTPPRYHPAAKYVPPILIGYFLVGLYYFVSSPLFYFEKTKVLPFVTGTAALFNIFLNYLLIPRYGAIAAAWVTLASYGLMLVLYYIVAQNTHRVAYPTARCFLALLFILGSLWISALLPSGNPAAVIVKLSLCGTYLVIVFIMIVRPYRLAADRAG